MTKFIRNPTEEDSFHKICELAKNNKHWYVNIFDQKALFNSKPKYQLEGSNKIHGQDKMPKITQIDGYTKPTDYDDLAMNIDDNQQCLIGKRCIKGYHNRILMI